MPVKVEQINEYLFSDTVYTRQMITENKDRLNIPIGDLLETDGETWFFFCKKADA